MRTSFFALGVVLVLGCGGSKLAPVSGTVTLDGKPLAKASVTFQPNDPKQMNPGPGSTALTNENGEYTLQQTGSSKGAVVGLHRVEISCPIDDGKSNPDDDRQRKPRDRVPPRYNVQSTLQFEVKLGDNTADWKLTSH
jgi:hypothetical protein